MYTTNFVVVALMVTIGSGQHNQFRQQGGQFGQGGGQTGQFGHSEQSGGQFGPQGGQFRAQGGQFAHGEQNGHRGGEGGILE